MTKPTATPTRKANKIATQGTDTNASYYLTFVDSENSSAAYEDLKTSDGNYELKYIPSTGTLHVQTLSATNLSGTSSGEAGSVTNTITFSNTGNGDASEQPIMVQLQELFLIIQLEHLKQMVQEHRVHGELMFQVPQQVQLMQLMLLFLMNRLILLLSLYL